MRKFGFVFLVLAVITLSGCSLFGKKAETITITPTPTASVKMLKEGEGPQVTLVPSFDKQQVTLKITKITSDIKKIDYEIVYDTNGVQRGVLGSIVVADGQDSIEKKLLLGSCSKNICVFDKNVKNLILTVKFSGEKEPLEFQKEYSF